MVIDRVKITNFKCVHGERTIQLKKGLNILVGDNEVGKSTVLEALHLAFTGEFHGRSVRSNLFSYLFNTQAVAEYLAECRKHKMDFVPPPEIRIEVWFKESVDAEMFEGDDNSEKKRDVEGFTFIIDFDAADCQQEYQELLAKGKIDPTFDIQALPLEYYRVRWTSFQRDQTLSPRKIPARSVLIDSANYQYRNGSDVMVQHALKDVLLESDVRTIVNAHREALLKFGDSEVITEINKRIKERSSTMRRVSVSAESADLRSWENDVVAQVDQVPFAFAGRGSQCVVKTDLALCDADAKGAKLILLEEPESHLSPHRLNQFMAEFGSRCEKVQAIVSTHSSFVANKLGIGNILLMSKDGSVRFTDLPESNFFKRLPGYDTLRLVLAERVILVEGASDELVVQRAYMDMHDGRLPLEDGIDVVSVGIAFSRYVDMLKKLDKKAAIITDNDGETQRLIEKYKGMLPSLSPIPNQAAFFSLMSLDEKTFDVPKETVANYSTLEPYLLKANSLQTLNVVLGTSCANNAEMLKHMHANKTDCALKIFESAAKIQYPDYIKQAIKHVEVKS